MKKNRRAESAAKLGDQIANKGMRVYFATREQAETFMTVLGNLDLDPNDIPQLDSSRDFHPWYLEITGVREPSEDEYADLNTEQKVICAAREGFTWGFEHGSGKYIWNDVQGRMTYTGDDPPPLPNGTRVVRTQVSTGRPEPSVGTKGTVIGSNGNALIIAFDGITYPLPNDRSKGHWLFMEDIAVLTPA